MGLARRGVPNVHLEGLVGCKEGLVNCGLYVAEVGVDGRGELSFGEQGRRCLAVLAELARNDLGLLPVPWRISLCRRVVLVKQRHTSERLDLDQDARCWAPGAGP